ncbi:MAG: hypothetical protein IPK50_13355 [Fibrobacterota bacterium]|nr:MAG: hypothetical protein IPK50_13355 [Fibrobacterota bacterium]
MILLLLASALPLTDATKTVDGIFCQRPDPATGKSAVIAVGPGHLELDSPDNPRKRSIERTDTWLIVHETQVPATEHDPLRQWVRFYPVVGPAIEPLFPAERISLVRHGAMVGAPIRPWNQKQRLWVRAPSDDRKWISVGSAPLELGEYHEDGDGLSMGGDISARVAGDRLEVTVTYAGSWQNEQGGDEYVHEETIYSYPLGWLKDGRIGHGYEALEVKIRAED